MNPQSREAYKVRKAWEYFVKCVDAVQIEGKREGVEREQVELFPETSEGEKGENKSEGGAVDVEARRREQYRMVTEANPMLDDYHRGIRNVEDVRTFDEVLAEAEKAWAEYGDLTYPDMDIEQLRNAKETGRITIYSSKPIEVGTFVTPSRMNAEDYAGGGKVYEKEVGVNDVAWTGEDEGQFAPVITVESTEAQESKRINRFSYFGGSIQELVAKAKENATGLLKKIIAPVSERLRTDLSSKGIEIDDDYKHVIDHNAIRHTLKNHGSISEEARGQVPISEEDFVRLGDIVANYDKVDVEDGKRVKENIIYSKTYEDGTTIFVEEKRAGRKELAAVTMWKMKNPIRTDANHPKATQISDLNEISAGKGSAEKSEKQEKGEEISEEPPLGGRDYSISGSGEEFDKVRERAIREVGTVMPGLKDKEVRVVNVPMHDFVGDDTREQARKWARAHLKGTYQLTDSEGKKVNYTISNRSINKYLSDSSIKESENKDVHLSVLKMLPQVIGESIEAEVHPDYGRDENRDRTNNIIQHSNILIHRFYGAVEIDGVDYRVKTTIKETKNGNGPTVPHSFEVIEIGLLPKDNNPLMKPKVAMNKSKATHRTANLLKGVEKSYDKGKFLLDESKDLTKDNVSLGDFKAEDYKEYSVSVRKAWEDPMSQSYLGMSEADKAEFLSMLEDKSGKPSFASRFVQKLADNNRYVNDWLKGLVGARRNDEIARMFNGTTPSRFRERIPSILEHRTNNAMTQLWTPMTALRMELGKKMCELLGVDAEDGVMVL